MAKAKRPVGHTNVQDLDDKIIECRGDSHPWPKFRLRGDVPKGIRYTPMEFEGRFEIDQVCPNCGRHRWRLTVPHSAAPDPADHWHYDKGPLNFSAAPGMGFTRSNYTEELYRRIAEHYASAVK